MNGSLGRAAMFACALTVLASCERKTEVATPIRQSAASNAAGTSPNIHTYHSRGIVQSIPEAGRPTTELHIQHEAINDFVDGTGAVVGMNAMRMPFPALGKDVSLEGIVVGDKVSFSFTVTWSAPDGNAPRPTWIVNSIEKLPAETELTFSAKQVPASPENTSDTEHQPVPAGEPR